MTDRPIGGLLDHSKFLPDDDAIRGQARIDARDALRRALAAVRVAAEGETQDKRCASLAACHAALCDAADMLEAVA